MYPVKLYNGSRVLIYQEDAGRGNSGKLPSGGVLASSAASSMSAVVANPITLYGNVNIGAVIDQVGQSGDLYNYYWTSYSRGTDGQRDNTNFHNLYLDSYIPLRHKSIYDPCPYGYRIPSNGTYNQFRANARWTMYSYVGGTVWINTWIVAQGWLNQGYIYCGYGGFLFMSTSASRNSSYCFAFDYNLWYSLNHDQHYNVEGQSVRCIEECEHLYAEFKINN